MDFIVRFLTFVGFQIKYVRNITDIDDKIIQRASLLNISYDILSNNMIEEMSKCFTNLNIQPPHYEPRATSYINEMIQMIEHLYNKGCAYTLDGDVYFSIKSFPLYGQLSKREIKNSYNLRTANLAKVHNCDFILWKKFKAHEPCFPSPFGLGRPGWHIECSAMSSSLLGSVFDIHAGGIDLLFPHHENEIAQSCCVYGQYPANYWLHFGMIDIDGKKMSKSLNNAIFIDEVLSIYSANVVRLMFLTTNYRSALSFNWKSLDNVQKAWRKICNGLIPFLPCENTVDTNIMCNFVNIMRNNFAFSQVYGFIFTLLKELNITKSKAIAASLYKILITLGFIIDEKEVRV
jgi:cysteinyl-tRNA synthetase